MEEEKVKLSQALEVCKEQVNEEEYRADEAVKQVSVLLERERELCQERRTLNQQLARFQLDLTRNFKLALVCTV